MTPVPRSRHYVDLHMHTTASDGTFTPEQLVDYFSSRGYRAVSVTDHDAWDAISPVTELARKVGLEVIPGIELSTAVGDAEIHLLGYFIDYLDPEFQRQISHFKEARIERARKIVEKLKELGVHIEAERVLELARTASVGRPHVARALLEEGYVGSSDEAFARYLRSGAPAYVPKPFLSTAEACRIVHSVGGLCFYAHPGIENRDELIEQFAAEGLDGIEAWHSKHSPAQVKHYQELAKRYGLLVSGGSDSHGPEHRDQPNGGGHLIKVPYEVVDRMKERLGLFNR